MAITDKSAVILEYIFKFMYRHMSPFLLDVYLEVEWAGGMACVYKIRVYIRFVFKKLPKCFLKWVVLFYIFTSCV